jgi:hypothetical protein
MAKKEEKKDDTKDVLLEILSIARKSCMHRFALKESSDYSCSWECELCNAVIYAQPEWEKLEYRKWEKK